MSEWLVKTASVMHIQLKRYLMKKKIIMMNSYIATLLHNNGFFRGFQVLT